MRLHSSLSIFATLLSSVASAPTEVTGLQERCEVCSNVDRVTSGLVPAIQSLWRNRTSRASFTSSPSSSSSSSSSSLPSSTVYQPPPPVGKGSGGEDLPRFILYGDQFHGGTLGVPNPSEIKGFNIYNVAFWMSDRGASDNALEWTQGTDAQRTRRKKQYTDAGIKLMVSLFGADDKPQSNGHDPRQLAARVARFVRKYQFDGVDIDYEEETLFANGKATPWIKDFTVALREQLPSPQYLISHAPLAPWFSNAVFGKNSYLSILNDPVIGGGIDFYNVQFYNQDDYQTIERLLYKSTVQWPKTSLFEIGNHRRTLAQDRLSKLVIGKPARKSDAFNGYMRPEVLANAYFQARDRGWMGGLMFFEYPNIDGEQLASIRGLAAQRYRAKQAGGDGDGSW